MKNFAALLCAWSLVSCGGGSAPLPNNGSPTLSPMGDSFGRSIPESDFGGGDPGAAGADGTASDRAPIVNAPVVLSDSAGHSTGATTDAQGYYRINIKGFVPPFVAKVTRADGTAWYSQSSATLKTRGFITMNINGLTDKMAGYVAVAMNLGGDASKVMPAMLATNPSLLPASRNKLNAGLASPLTFVGLSPSSFDPVGLPYQAFATQAYNQLLERVYATKDKVTGNTVVVGTFAGVTENYVDGPLAVAGFKYPADVAMDSKGTIFVADTGHHAVRKISPAGVVSTLAGSGTFGFADGAGAAATFNAPKGLAVDRNGNVFVADSGNQAIRKITPAGVVSTLASSALLGISYIVSQEAVFVPPTGIAVDSNGNVFVADATNHTIRKITPTGVISTFSGSGAAGFDDGAGVAASFNQPRGLAVDANDNVFVADTGNQAIRKITPNGAVTTFAGNKNFGFVDGTGVAARFSQPSAVAVDSGGNVFVADTSNHGVRKITPLGVVSTLVGDGPVGLVLHRPGQLTLPSGLAASVDGNVFVTGTADSVIWILLQ